MIGIVIDERRTKIEFAPIMARGYWCGFRVPFGSRNWRRQGEYGFAFSRTPRFPYVTLYWFWRDTCYPEPLRRLAHRIAAIAGSKT